MYKSEPKHEAKIAVMPTYSHMEQELVDMILASRKKPTMMPQGAFEAANWFVRLSEPQKRQESIRTRKTKDGHEYFVWPYADRMKYLLNEFLGSTEELQTLVVAAREDQIFWRGDNLKSFAKVIEETEKMREIGIDKYHKAAKTLMQAIC